MKERSIYVLGGGGGETLSTDRRYLRMGWQATCSMTMEGSRSLRALMAEMYTVRMSDVGTPDNNRNTSEMARIVHLYTISIRSKTVNVYIIFIFQHCCMSIMGLYSDGHLDAEGGSRTQTSAR